MAATDRPNILLILTDQHRLSALGCYGETPCQTPHLDRLAHEGVRFETAYTVCPVCTPSRATIMTGLYPHSHGMCSNVHDLGSSVHELRDRPSLLSRRLLAAGYQCGYTGKWHLGSDRTTSFDGPNMPSLPRDVGFSGQNFPGHGNGGFHYPEYRAYLAEHGWEHAYSRVDRCPHPVMPYAVLHGPTESTVDYFLAEHTIGLIDRMAAQAQPFFIWHNFWGPHSPYFVPRAHYERYRDVEIPPWPNYDWPEADWRAPMQVKRHPMADETPWEDWAVAIRHYYAFATLIDEQIGRIVEHLRRRGLLENTVILFSADHGETLGSHGGLTDKGWHHFEEVQRIPLIAYLPPRWIGNGPSAGAVLPEWASTIDYYPTILDLAGTLRPDEALPGRSLLPLLRGERVAWRDRVFVEFMGVNDAAASMITIRHGDLKYGWNCSNRDELYDLARDPHERRNVIDDPAYADDLLSLREMMSAWMAETDYPAKGVFDRSRLRRTRWIIPPAR